MNSLRTIGLANTSRAELKDGCAGEQPPLLLRAMQPALARTSCELGPQADRPRLPRPGEVPRRNRAQLVRVHEDEQMPALLQPSSQPARRSWPLCDSMRSGHALGLLMAWWRTACCLTPLSVAR